MENSEIATTDQPEVKLLAPRANSGDRQLKTIWGHDVVRIWILATSSLLVGLVINQFRNSPIPLVYQSRQTRILAQASALVSPDSQPPSSPAPLPTLPPALTLATFRELSPAALVLDARPEIFHRLGHIPGAISLPRDDFENAYPLVRERLEPNKAQPLILYCASASCEDAELVRTALTKLGYTNISIFTGGWAEWSGAGLPEDRND